MGEVAQAVLFGASPASSYATGAVIDVNGGFSACEVVGRAAGLDRVQAS
jgi:NAD(P)-dependent dehydrogenase (short-subunit alcohol dehydrogenase family)